MYSLSKVNSQAEGVRGPVYLWFPFLQKDIQNMPEKIRETQSDTFTS